MSPKRFGLSFEIAAPPAVHPNRTDIACFIGTVARRRTRTPVQLMPEVLARWLESQDVALPSLPLRTRRVDLRSAQTLSGSLRDGLQGSGQVQRTVARLIEVLAEAQHTQQALLDALLAACRDLTPLPASIVEDLRSRGFYPGGHLTGPPLAAWLRIQQLHDLPVVLESFETFDALFSWDARPVLTVAPRPGDPQVCSPLGAAIRAFFGEGGARCYVVRSGDPVPLFGSASERFGAITAFDYGAGRRQRDSAGALAPAVAAPMAGNRAQLTDLVPQFAYPAETLQGVIEQPAAPMSTDPAQWCGLQHVFGLADVSFVCLPDLPDAVAYRLDDEAPPEPPAGVPQETFKECAEAPVPARRPVGRLLAPPRARDEGLQAWIILVRRALAMLDNGGRSFNRRDVELLVSLPLADTARGAPKPDDWLAWMASKAGGEDSWWSSAEEIERGEAFARLQVAYPWLLTRESADCAGGVEAPEGALAGLLARNALAHGAFRSAAFLPLLRYLDAEPSLDLARAVEHAVDTPAGPLSLAERVCLIGASPRGPQLWSDVTFATQAPWRPGSVRRLTNTVINAARRAGDEYAFEPNGEALWAQVRQRLGELGRELLAAGALSSDAGTRAFVVRCGRDTMTQADLDAGRLIAEIELVPAQPILRIVVVLALRDAQPQVAAQAAA
jgi:Bacteriophage tail sheath protein